MLKEIHIDDISNDNAQDRDNINKHILIIEDMGEMRSMLKSLMTSLGYKHIDIESSGQVALKSVLEKNYDIILSDFNLGGSIDGQQILETARKNYAHDYSSIFIMITADTMYESVVSVLEYQPDSYIVKPFTPSSFYRRFDKVKRQKKIFERLYEARNNKQYELVERYAHSIMKTHPHYSSICLKIIGESMFDQGKYKNANHHYKKVLENNPTLAWAHFGIAKCEMKLDNQSSAEEHLKQTIKLSRHFLSAYDLLADIQENTQNLKAAQETMVKAIEVSSRSIERSQRHGRISATLEDWSVAEQSYSRVLRLTKNSENESIEDYYEHLKCLTNISASGKGDKVLAIKFKRSLSRTRLLAKTNPAALSNSFRLEIQQYLVQENIGEAVSAWQRWNRLIEAGDALDMTEGQRNSLKKHLGIL